MTAVRKVVISNPGTIRLTTHNIRTLIKNAAIPKVTKVIGNAMSCKTGRRKVLTTPSTIAVTTAVQRSAIENPGRIYSTINKVSTLIRSVPISFI